MDYLRPDGKSQVTVEYDGDKPVRVDAVVISTQHSPRIDIEELRAQIRHNDDLYYNQDAPELEDFEYDQLTQELKRLEMEFPQLVSAEAYSQVARLEKRLNQPNVPADLASVLAECTDSNGRVVDESAFIALMAGEPADVCWRGLPLQALADTGHAARFGFVACPRP